MRTMLTLLFGFSFLTVFAQAPLQEYEELTDSKPVNSNMWDETPQGIHLSWGSTDVRYNKFNVPPKSQLSSSWRGIAWKGERINAQFVLWTTVDINKVSYTVSDLQNSNGAVIPSAQAEGGFIRYVMTDELNKAKTSGCGLRPDKTEWDSSLVADVIDINKSLPIKARTVRPIWLSIQTPPNIPPGIYKGEVTVYINDLPYKRLPFSVKVLNHQLPTAAHWKFHLDLWQNPFAVARYYQTGLWTKEHLAAMEGVMKPLARAGQKVITTSIMHKPWNGQTYDYFESMVTWTKKVDGTWHFDFGVFDRWVEFMMGIGIDKQINCYSMVPWALSFQYFDQASNQMQTIKTQPGEQAYDEMWLALLRSFAKHLKEKGWFEKTLIAMDERPLKDMQQVIALIKRADPDFKLSLAGLYYDEIDKDIHDYCLSTDQVFPADALKRRKEEGKISTYYTYCADTKPNTFTFSEPAEAAWIGIYAATLNLNGYLRWAYNSWNETPLTDSRFVTWAAGDTYLVYPGFRSSIRFERLIEGIQDYEKIRILREGFQKDNNQKKLKQIDAVLSGFSLKNLSKQPASEAVKAIRNTLNSL